MKKTLIGALALVSALGYSQVLFETGFEAGEGYALGSISTASTSTPIWSSALRRCA